jgi:hypothetical protein
MSLWLAPLVTPREALSRQGELSVGGVGPRYHLHRASVNALQ